MEIEGMLREGTTREHTRIARAQRGGGNRAKVVGLNQ
jgi:hypothetical protein